MRTLQGEMQIAKPCRLEFNELKNNILLQLMNNIHCNEFLWEYVRKLKNRCSLRFQFNITWLALLQFSFYIVWENNISVEFDEKHHTRWMWHHCAIISGWIVIQFVLYGYPLSMLSSFYSSSCSLLPQTLCSSMHKSGCRPYQIGLVSLTLGVEQFELEI